MGKMLSDFFRNWIQKHFPVRKKSRNGHSKKRHQKDILGAAGEEQAVRFLKSQGYTILDRNVAYDDGELDIVAKQGERVVFVEVKTRRPHPTLHPSLAVNGKKQRKIKLLAARYLKKIASTPDIRFDVVTVIWPENQSPALEHFMDAFR
ncbi:MAG: YraN family protein [Planctomycetaceae bacterium]|jgi:putative endonuclease|nr:YraN family protein [Planctomycetaceae bacterium]